MSERNGAQITELEFKRLCGEVWADSLSCHDPFRPGATAGRGTVLLGEVLRLVRKRLQIESEAPIVVAHDAATYRNEIDSFMYRFAAVPFDHNKIIDRLLREIMQQVA